MLRALFLPQSRPKMGLGHVMRSAALAEAMRETLNAQTHFALGNAAQIQQLARQNELEIITLPGIGRQESFCEAALQTARDGWDIVVVDCYDATEDFFRSLRDAVPCSVCIDDLNAHSLYVSHLVVNGNAYGPDLDYHVGPDTRLLLGAPYAINRREFREARFRPRELHGGPLRLLVTMGGSDADNLTLRVARQLHPLEADFEAALVVGAGYSHSDELEAFAAKYGRFTIHRTPPRMSELMRWADLAVTAGGSTCYEAAIMGLPAVAVVAAENQVPLANKLHELGTLVCIGPPEAVEQRLAPEVAAVMANEGRRLEMGRRGQELIDGRGALRVAEKIGRLCARTVRGR